MTNVLQALRKAGGSSAQRVPLQVQNAERGSCPAGNATTSVSKGAMGPPMKTPAQIAAAGK